MRIELRILTGRHAGARVILDTTHYLISSQIDADLQITDWSCEPIILENHDATVQYHSVEDKNSKKRNTLAFLQPKRFGMVVLCVGSADEPWPDEIALLEAVFRPEKALPKNPSSSQETQSASTPLRKKIHQRRLHWIAAATLCLAISGAWYGWLETHAAAPQDPRMLLDRFRTELLEMEQPNVQTRLDGTDIVVSGMVNNHSDRVRIQHWIAKHPWQWRVHLAEADSIAQAIYEALGEKALSVDYIQNGVFRISGNTRHGQAIRQRIAQLTNDFAGQVSSIQTAIHDIDPYRELPHNYDSALADHSLYYVETPDGTKHFNFQSDSLR